MRFARQCSIFRGPLDPAPLVGVFFLLVIFMLLGSTLYTPGVLVDFGSPDAGDGPVITVTKSGDILFNGKTNKLADLEQLRSGDLKSAPGAGPFRLQAQDGADPNIVERVRELFQVTLPAGDSRYLAGTDNPTVLVAVNFRGQCFFENRPVRDFELQNELRRRLQETGSGSKLTMVLAADKAASAEVIMGLCRLAEKAGVTEVLLAERPNDVDGRVKLRRP